MFFFKPLLLEAKQIYEEKIGMHQFHPSVIKTSFLINLSWNAYEQEFQLENVFKFILSPPPPPPTLPPFFLNHSSLNQN